MEIIKLNCTTTLKITQVTVPHPLAKVEPRYRDTRELDYEYLNIISATPIGTTIESIEDIFAKGSLVVIEPVHKFVKEGTQYKGFIRKFSTDFETITIELIIQP